DQVALDRAVRPSVMNAHFVDHELDRTRLLARLRARPRLEGALDRELAALVAHERDGAVAQTHAVEVDVERLILLQERADERDHVGLDVEPFDANDLASFRIEHTPARAVDAT